MYSMTDARQQVGPGMSSGSIDPTIWLESLRRYMRGDYSPDCEAANNALKYLSLEGIDRFSPAP